MNIETIIDPAKYPNLTIFIDRYCRSCDKHCAIPSIDILSCVLGKLTEESRCNLEIKQKGEGSQ